MAKGKDTKIPDIWLQFDVAYCISLWKVVIGQRDNLPKSTKERLSELIEKALTTAGVIIYREPRGKDKRPLTKREQRSGKP